MTRIIAEKWQCPTYRVVNVFRIDFQALMDTAEMRNNPSSILLELIMKTEKPWQRLFLVFSMVQCSHIMLPLLSKNNIHMYAICVANTPFAVLPKKAFEQWGYNSKISILKSINDYASVIHKDITTAWHVQWVAFKLFSFHHFQPIYWSNQTAQTLSCSADQTLVIMNIKVSPW